MIKFELNFLKRINLLQNAFENYRKINKNCLTQQQLETARNYPSDSAGKVITRKAAVMWMNKQPFYIEKIQVAPPKAHEVRIKHCETDVCHTDSYNFDNLISVGQFPVIRGQKEGGLFESVGDGFKNVAPGDHVIPFWVSQCSQSKLCKSKYTNLCSKLNATQRKALTSDGATHSRCKIKPVFHLMSTSKLSQFTAVTDISNAKNNKNAPLDKISILGCGIPTEYAAAINDVNGGL